MAKRTAAGIDVAVARPCTCVLVDGYEVQDWLDTKDLGELRDWVLRHWPDAVAVDAPCSTSKGLLLKSEGNGKVYAGRVCDRELRRRGIRLNEVPRDRADADTWMEVGFQIYELLQDLGYQLPRENGLEHSVLEVFPHASFVTLLGGVPAKKVTDLGQSQRLAVLRQQGLRWEYRIDHDSLDALAAALTALRYLEGEASAIGDPEEALVWLPVTRVEDSYSRLSASVTQVDEIELEHLHSLLLPEEREELLQCLLDAAPYGGEAMIEILDQWLLCCARTDLAGGRK
jgi:predicted nuclease with RNAse H fold